MYILHVYKLNKSMMADCVCMYNVYNVYIMYKCKCNRLIIFPLITIRHISVYDYVHQAVACTHIFRTSVLLVRRRMTEDHV